MPKADGTDRVGEGISIRRGRMEDAEGFRRCLGAVARERRWLFFIDAPDPEDVERFLEESAPIQFLAERGGEIVGWCDITPSLREGCRHTGILGMGLRAEYRGLGLGRKLLRRALEAAHAAGLTRIELEVFASNRRAIDLYEKAGFAHEGRKRGARILDGRVEDILLMALLRPHE